MRWQQRSTGLTGRQPRERSGYLLCDVPREKLGILQYIHFPRDEQLETFRSSRWKEITTIYSSDQWRSILLPLIFTHLPKVTSSPPKHSECQSTSPVSRVRLERLAIKQDLPAIFELRNCDWHPNMASLSVFPAPPSMGEVTLCEMNARLIAEDYSTAKLSKYVPATQVQSVSNYLLPRRNYYY